MLQPVDVTVGAVTVTASGVVTVTAGQTATSRPDATTTGHDGNLTREFGWTEITQKWLDANNGGSRLLENVRFTSQVGVRVNDLTIRNFEVTGGGKLYGIENNVFSGSPTTGLVLEDGELFGSTNGALIVSNATLRRLHVHHQGADAFKPYRNVLIEDCYVHHLGNQSPDVHADGVQMVVGHGVTVRGCNFDMRHDEPGFTNSQVMIIQTNNGPIDDILIEGNWINGGGYSVQIRDKGTGHGVPTNVRLLNNRFGRDYQFGLWLTHGNVEIAGNVWDDTGEPI